MTFDVHSKLLLPIFASPKLKKDVEKRNGTKKAGAETMIHAFQQAMIQSPDFDLSSADAIKASKISSAMKRWSKRVSTAIAKAANRGVAFKAAQLGDSIFEHQSETLMTEATTVNSLFMKKSWTT